MHEMMVSSRGGDGVYEYKALLDLRWPKAACGRSRFVGTWEGTLAVRTAIKVYDSRRAMCARFRQVEVCSEEGTMDLRSVGDICTFRFCSLHFEHRRSW
jgi:hypothetical protein